MKKLLTFLLILAMALSIVSCDEDAGTDLPNDPDVSDSDTSSDDTPGDDTPGDDTPGDDTPGDGECTNHSDKNNDGSCDVCAETVIVIIDFYAINDLHGRIFDTDDQPGVDELTTYFENARNTDDHVIVLANGDMWQGTSESNLTRGKMMTEWLNAIGAVSMTLGNHEFDWANDYIYSNLAIADFPFLAINIYNTKTNKRVDFATPSIVVECGGAKVGIIGAIGDCHSSISQDKVMGIEFKVGSELSALVKAESERLRAEGCDYVIFTVHDGVARSGTGTISSSDIASFYDVALSDGYIDLVFESHSHCNYILKDENGVYHIQGGGENDALSHVEVKLNFANDNSEIRVIETVGADVYDDCKADNIVKELKEKYKADIAKGDEKLGTIIRNVNGDELRQLSIDLYLEKGLAKWGSQYNIVLSGGYVSIRSPGMITSGNVYYKDLYSLFPFDNGLYLCSISGANLKDKFINSTNANYFICMSEYGKSLNVSDSGTYYIITDAYSAFYAANGLTIVDAYGEELFARDMIAEYIKNGGYGEEDTNVGGTKFTSIPEIVSKITALGVNVETEESFLVIGTIIDDPQATYGNCTIRDTNGNTIYIYGIYDQSGNRYDSFINKPVKGDTIIISGRALLYVNTANPGEPKPEIKNAVIDKFFKTSDISEALAAGEALADNTTTSDYFILFGKVKDTPNATYGNMTVVDANGDEIYIYGCYDSTGDIRYDAMAVKPEAGDTVVIYGWIKKYVKTGEAPLIEIERGRVIVIYKPDGLLYIV
ncbi:MAG: bifunctional metallophosphatase/5'-nucleotidase [Ruminococcaceae bacterium]|nr:bifunctional metallophosphatase/5'-nucleotidase [Oscillospiraceae bacterium]